VDSIIALFSHITKGFDYEESVLALITAGVLMYQRSEYTKLSDPKIIRKGWIPAIIIAKTVLVLGTLGFWLLDNQHFGTDFTWQQSAGYAFQTFFLITPDSLHPLTSFGADFLDMLQISGGLTMLLLFYAVLRPYLPQFENEINAREKAIGLVSAYGNSALDYFKTYSDKLYFFPKNDQSFIAYKNTASYALALENPVAPNDVEMRASVAEFDAFCRKKGLRSIYYRIPESSAPLYRSMGKSLLPLGQEAIVNLTSFTLEGKDKKSIRNGLHKMEREGYQFVVHPAPLNGRLLQQLKAVSDDWLKMLDRGELTFSQGIFDESEIKQQTVATMEDSDGKIIAFVNFIPGGSSTEANFDLMRRINDAPNGTMDFLFASMFTHLKSAGYTTCNLGMVPMAGLQHPVNLPENIIKLAYERLPQFAGFKSLRFFKEKFDPVWETKYVAYDSQLDLINLPAALGKVVSNHYPPEKRGITSRHALPSQ
jgi:phosphatidylglycerol lysyltransferase